MGLLFVSGRGVARSLVVGIGAAGLVGTALAGAVMVPAGAVAVAAGVSLRVVADDTVLGTFEALGTGVNNWVYALAVKGDDTVYAGGDFTAAGGKSGADYIAAWSNADDTWHALGTGASGPVRALALSADDTLYAGGAFSVPGVPDTSNIAAWSTVTRNWSALGTGVSNWVYALAVSGDDTVYAGGDFSVTGVPDTSNIAAWSNADDTWRALGTGVNNRVYALAVSGDDTVYAGGAFLDAGGVSGTRGIAAWSNADDTWSALGIGVGCCEVYALALQGDDTVYAGGAFSELEVPAWSTVTRNWSALGTDVNGYVHALAADDTRGLVYAGGEFTAAGGVTASKVAVWDMGLDEWIAMQAAGGEGVIGQVSALALDDSVLYLGGGFTSAGGVAADMVARWTWAAPSVVAVPVSGAAGVSIDLVGAGLIGVSGVRVDGTPVAYTRDDSTTISLTLPGGLSPGSHSITVDAVGGRATTAYVVSGSPTPPPVYPPGAPTSALAVAGDASASVSWLAPTSAGSFPVTDYEVASAPIGGSCLVQVPAVACTVSGLTNGTSYTFTVRALNGAGWGASSGPSNAVTPRAAPVKAIQITGSRDVSDPRLVRVSGTTTEVVGEQVTPWVRFPGQASYTAGVGVKTVAADGTFGWSRVAGKRVYVYFTNGSVKSNTVVIAAR